MAAEKNFSTATIIAVIVLAIAIALPIGWQANDAAGKVAVLENERSVVASAPRSGFDAFGNNGNDQAVSDARIGYLDNQISYAREVADSWAIGFFIYVFGVVALALIVGFIIPALPKPAPRREDFSEFTELGRDVKSGIRAAAKSIKKAMPRQPTIGGGRLSSADELRKWTELRKEGLVSEEEFQKMRDKLVG